MNSPSLPEPFIPAKGSSCGLGDRIWGLARAEQQTHQKEFKRKGVNWVFSHLLPLLSPPQPSPSFTPTPSPQSLASRFLGTVVCAAVLINRQTRGGWEHKLQIPGPLPGAAIRQAGHRALVWSSLCSPWKLTPSWAVREGAPWTWKPLCLPRPVEAAMPPPPPLKCLDCLPTEKEGKPPPQD